MWWGWQLGPIVSTHKEGAHGGLSSSPLLFLASIQPGPSRSKVLSVWETAQTEQFFKPSSCNTVTIFTKRKSQKYYCSV